MNSLKSLYFDAAEPDSQRWKMLVEKHAKRAQTFEIHCWKEEPEWIDLALQYGIPKETDWPYGTVISGPVTPEFLHMLLCLPKPMDTEIYNKMTPFFPYSLITDFLASTMEQSCTMASHILCENNIAL